MLKLKVVSKMKKMEKSNIGIIVISALVALIFSVFTILYYVGGDFVFRLSVGSKYTSISQKMSSNVSQKYDSPENDTSWIQDAVNTNMLSVVSTKNNDLELFAVKYMAETTSDVWVITLHGYRSRWKEMAGIAQEFHNRGYNVIIPDMRGQGESKYAYLGMGYFDRFDVLSWIDYIISINSNAKIILHGRSMGGAAVMMTTGEKLPSNVKCAIEECGYTNVYDEFKHVIENVLHYGFSDLIMTILDGATKRTMGVSLKDMDSVAQLKKSKTPTLFIHGSKDSFVPFSMLDKVYNANNNIIKEKLVIDAEHAMSSTVDHDLYFSTVFNFIDRFI